MSMSSPAAIVTGSTGAIGQAIVEQLINDGYSLMLHYHQATETAEALQQKYGKDRIIIHQGDLRNSHAAIELVETTFKQFGRLDLLVNNAGITDDRSILMISPESWQDFINLNLNSVFYCTKAVARKMIGEKKGGVIVNIASVSGMMGVAYQANYAATKAGIIGFTKSVCKELAPFNIRVNAVAPGFIESVMFDNIPEHIKTKYLDNVPLKRIGKPEEVGAVVGFLASERASYMTGQVVVVDGGISA